MTLIKPFRALRPAPGRAAEVLAPPYDVLSSAEARERAKGKAWSFLHVSKAEIDLDPATDPYDGAVYAKAAANLKGGAKVDDFLEWFPGVTREQVEQVITFVEDHEWLTSKPIGRELI